MVEVIITDRNRVQPVTVGAHLLRAIYARHQKDWQWRTAHMDRLAGTDELRLAVEREGGIEQFLPRWDRETKAFEKARRQYLLYR
jgi:uncharacterized protein YbbC (DUF1343 family)